ncbi:hypothetical protein NDN08_007339 [Rhodosorus marinus]|uniref:Uncharacterized protein n=1 Tax=Rhodosorus marinus TaxID=101924 RepID=A0AAV8UHN5_9RHOD|nr:hypothetical protein NDN08_007339 [Rhodosorus marinus]
MSDFEQAPAAEARTEKKGGWGKLFGGKESFMSYKSRNSAFSTLSMSSNFSLLCWLATFSLVSLTSFGSVASVNTVKAFARTDCRFL